MERAGKKPIVPFTGKIEAKYLTHKQKRLMKKREKSGVTRGDNARDEVTEETCSRYGACLTSV